MEQRLAAVEIHITNIAPMHSSANVAFGGDDTMRGANPSVVARCAICVFVFIGEGVA
ncbi:MAG TPA: hypothetical protein VGK44_01740 [Casimicrobiaceae bacterium]|jgi:hypothetical protein